MERKYSSQLTQVKKKHTAIAIVSILLVIFGIPEVVGGLSLFVIAGLWGYDLSQYAPFIGGPAGSIGEVIGVLGFLWFIVGAMRFIAGKRLWNSERSGGTWGILSSVVAIAILLIFFPWLGYFIIIGILDILLIILIVVGRNSLR